MGMYDYLGDYQVKIFNIPIYYGEHFGLGFMGGKLSLYNKGEKLPLQTLYYKYPNNFTILDEEAYEGYDDKPKQMVHIIKDGKYFDTVALNDFKYIGKKVYNYHGALLNINSKQDMFNHIELKEEWKQRRDELEISYFPNGVHDCIMNDMAKYDELSPQYNNELENLNNQYKNKLYLEEKYSNEMTLGAYIDVAIDAFNKKDIEPDKFKDYKQNYEEIKKVTNEFLKTLKVGYVDRYFNWLGTYCDSPTKDLIKDFINSEIVALG